MSEPARVDLLVVDDDDEFRDTLARRFSRVGFQVSEASGGDQALEMVQRRDFDVAVFDMMMPGLSGLDLLKRFKENHVECEIVFLTGKGTVDTAVDAMKLGAFDYLQKPFPLQDLEGVIRRACERRQLRKENRQLRALLDRAKATSEMVGQSPVMQELFRLIERAGPSDKAILIQGESGTGKELVARALHEHSTRADNPMVIINCAALPEPLLESELFGHEKGSFTGAIGAKPGLFEVADGGTLFIDEIGEMPGALQANLALNKIKPELLEMETYFKGILRKPKKQQKKTTYQWQSNLDKELPELYSLMVNKYKLIASDTTYEQFKAVFTGQLINTIKPIKWHHDNATELLYFIDRLEQSNNIIYNSKRADYQRIASCFVKPNGKQFDVVWKSLKTNIEINLSREKQKAIDELINNF